MSSATTKRYLKGALNHVTDTWNERVLNDSRVSPATLLATPLYGDVIICI